MGPVNFSSIAVRSLSELLIIIVGILVALGTNDWWGRRQDRAEEIQILQFMQEDVKATVNLLSSTQRRVETDRQSLMTLSRGSAGEAGQLDPDGLAALLHSLWDVPPLTLQMTTQKELQGSDRLRLISDARMRRLLAHFQQTYDFAGQSYLDAFQYQQLKLDVYIAANLQLSQISKYAFENDAGDSPQSLQPLLPLKDHRVLLDDPLFQNHVAAKYFLLTYYVQQIIELKEVLSELDDEINNRYVLLTE